MSSIYGVNLLRPYFHLRMEENQKFTDYGTSGSPVYNYNYTGHADGIVGKYSAFYPGHADSFSQVVLPATVPLPVSMCFWVKVKAWNAHSNYAIVWSFSLPYFAFQTEYIRFSYQSRDNAGAQRSITINPGVLDRWYFVCCTCHSTGMFLSSFCLDGEGSNFQTVASTDTLNNPVHSVFNLGRHHADNQYSAWCEIDDVRIYNNISLTNADYKWLFDRATKPHDAAQVSFVNNGNVEVLGLEEDMEWTLLSSFLSDLELGKPRYATALAGNSINTFAQAQAAGWTISNMDSKETAGYIRRRGYMQMYASGAPIGVISRNLPSGYTHVKIRWANWFTGTADVSIGGIVRRTLPGSFGADECSFTYTGTQSLAFSENGIVWLGDIWVGKKRPKLFSIAKGNRQKLDFRHNRYTLNGHPYDSWTVSSGTVGNFNQNGQTAENVRVMKSDPWGWPAIVWECRPAGDNNDDGGWNHTAIPINNQSTYRYSVWVRRRTDTGTFYHGVNGFGATNGVHHRSNGGLNTNPYFAYGTTGNLNQWILVVGHVFPFNAGTGASHPDSGLYTRHIKFSDGMDDFYWHSSTTTARGRTYLYYTPNTDNLQELIYPRFEVLNADSPTIGDLLSGKAYGAFGKSESDRLTLTSITQRVLNGEIQYNGHLIIK